MRSYQNAFRLRAAEFNDGRRSAFCANFAGDVLEFLPSHPFGVPIVLRSPPGAGKTSLMQILAAPWLAEVVKRPGTYPELVERLEDLQVLTPSGAPRISGCLINLHRDFSALMDIGAPAAAAERLFARLLDARVLAGHVQSAQLLGQAMSKIAISPADVVFDMGGEQDRLRSLMAEFVGEQGPSALTGTQITQWAHRVEADIRKVLYDLAPVDWDRFSAGPREFMSAMLVGDCSIAVAGIKLTPVTFLDDVHLLHPAQRTQLFDLIARRNTPSGFWLAERTEVLDPVDLIAGFSDVDDPSNRRRPGEEGRDYRLVDLTATGSSSRSAAYQRVLRTVAQRRAQPDLDIYADAPLHFLQLLDVEAGEDLRHVTIRIAERLNAVDDPRFSEWTDYLLASIESGDEQAICNARAGIALIDGEIRKQQGELTLGVALPLAELQRRLGSSVREAALLALGREYDVPVYYGTRDVLMLANENVSQLLRISADLFDHVLSAITRGRDVPTLTAKQQDKVIRKTSDALWREIPSRLVNGRSVQRLIAGAADRAYRLNVDRPVSYAPGISGFAITMTDCDQLLNKTTRERIPGGSQLLAALASAVAHNYLTKIEDAPRGRNEERRMIFYINRLLCPTFGLPLGRGGYRTRTVYEVASWVGKRSPAHNKAEVDDVSDGELATLFGEW